MTDRKERLQRGDVSVIEQLRSKLEEKAGQSGMEFSQEDGEMGDTIFHIGEREFTVSSLAIDSDIGQAPTVRYMVTEVEYESNPDLQEVIEEIGAEFWMQSEDGEHKLISSDL